MPAPDRPMQLRAASLMDRAELDAAVERRALIVLADGQWARLLRLNRATGRRGGRMRVELSGGTPYSFHLDDLAFVEVPATEREAHTFAVGGCVNQWRADHDDGACMAAFRRTD